MCQYVSCCTKELVTLHNVAEILYVNCITKKMYLILVISVVKWFNVVDEMLNTL